MWWLWNGGTSSSSLVSSGKKKRRTKRMTTILAFLAVIISLVMALSSIVVTVTTTVTTVTTPETTATTMASSRSTARSRNSSSSSVGSAEMNDDDAAAPKLVILEATTTNGTSIATTSSPSLPPPLPLDLSSSTTTAATRNYTRLIELKLGHPYRILHDQEDSLPIRRSSNNNNHDANAKEIKADLCFIKSIYATSVDVADKANHPFHNVTRFRTVNHPKFGFYFFTNLDDLNPPGWTKIMTTTTTTTTATSASAATSLLPYKRYITHSRFGKFLAWYIPEIQQKCQVILYMDGEWVPDKRKARVQDYIEFSQLVQQSPFGLMQDPQTHCESHRINSNNICTPLQEFDKIKKSQKDIDVNINASREWLLNQSDFNDAVTQVYLNTYFAYVPTSRRFQEISYHFWERYSQEVDSWRDQPLWAYMLKHCHNVTPTPFPSPNKKKKFKDLVIRRQAQLEGYDGHHYTTESDSDAVVQQQQQHRGEGTHVHQDNGNNIDNNLKESPTNDATIIAQETPLESSMELLSTTTTTNTNNISRAVAPVDVSTILQQHASTFSSILLLCNNNNQSKLESPSPPPLKSSRSFFRILCTSEGISYTLGSYKIRCRDLKRYAELYYSHRHNTLQIDAVHANHAHGHYNVTIVTKQIGEILQQRMLDLEGNGSGNNNNNKSSKSKLLLSTGPIYIDVIDQVLKNKDIPPYYHVIVQNQLQAKEVYGDRPLEQVHVVPHWYNSFEYDLEEEPVLPLPELRKLEYINDDNKKSPTNATIYSPLRLALIWDPRSGDKIHARKMIKLPSDGSYTYTRINVGFDDIGQWFLDNLLQGNQNNQTTTTTTTTNNDTSSTPTSMSTTAEQKETIIQTILDDPHLGPPYLYQLLFRQYDVLLVLGKTGGPGKKSRYNSVQRAVSQMRSGIPVLLECLPAHTELCIDIDKHDYPCGFTTPTELRDTLVRMQDVAVRRECVRRGLEMTKHYTPRNVIKDYLRILGYPYFND